MGNTNIAPTRARSISLCASQSGLLEQWIEYDLSGRVNPYGLYEKSI